MWRLRNLRFEFKTVDCWVEAPHVRWWGVDRSSVVQRTAALGPQHNFPSLSMHGACCRYPCPNPRSYCASFQRLAVGNIDFPGKMSNEFWQRSQDKIHTVDPSSVKENTYFHTHLTCTQLRKQFSTVWIIMNHRIWHNQSSEWAQSVIKSSVHQKCRLLARIE